MTPSLRECELTGEMGTTRIERRLALTLMVSLAACCGCAHQYLLKLSDGDQIISLSRPKSQGTNYYFTDDVGVGHVIPQNRVVKITAGAVPTEEKMPRSPTRPKSPKHWYFLWLA